MYRKNRRTYRIDFIRRCFIFFISRERALTHRLLHVAFSGNAKSQRLWIVDRDGVMIEIHLKNIRELNIIYTGERGNKNRIAYKLHELDATDSSGKSLNRRFSHVCVCVDCRNSARLGALCLQKVKRKEKEMHFMFRMTYNGQSIEHVRLSYCDISVAQKYECVSAAECG